MFRPVPRVLRLLQRQGTPSTRSLPASGVAHNLLRAPFVTVDDACEATATACAIRVFSTSPVSSGSGTADETAAPEEPAPSSSSSSSEAGETDAVRTRSEIRHDDHPNALRVSSTTAVNKLAGALLSAVQSGEVSVQTVGRVPAYLATRAIALANLIRKQQEEPMPPLVVTKLDDRAVGRGLAFSFIVQDAASLAAASGADPLTWTDLESSEDTNMFTLRAEMRAGLNAIGSALTHCTRGGAGHSIMSGIGSNAVSQGVLIVDRALRWCGEANVKAVVVPMSDQTEAKEGSDRDVTTVMRLHVLRTSAANPAPPREEQTKEPASAEE